MSYLSIAYYNINLEKDYVCTYACFVRIYVCSKWGQFIMCALANGRGGWGVGGVRGGGAIWRDLIVYYEEYIYLGVISSSHFHITFYTLFISGILRIVYCLCSLVDECYIYVLIFNVT